MPYPTKPKGGWQRPRQVVVNKSTAQLREKKATKKFMNKYPEIFQTNMAQSSNNPPGPFLYQEDGKTYASLPAEMLRNIQSSHLYEKNAKRLQGRGDRHTKDNDGQRSRSPHDDSAGVPAQGGRWPNAENEQSRNDGRASNQERSDTTTYDGISGHRDPEKQVSDVSIQTDTCDTLYVTKNTLTAYTIAVVQNSQALQYDQMHAALQSARNQSSLETPLKAEELLSAHFNLAVLESHTIPDAEECPNNTQNAEPSTSAPDEQTYVKIPSRYAENSTTRRTNPTGAVTPTRRGDFGLVNAIPAGYESDDSWDNMSHNHEHTHTHNIVPLLTLRLWRNSPRRPPEQQQFRQQSATNVRSGNAPYPRPWDSQPYGRRTRSQQALRARAYPKVQRRYPIQ